jgi:murein DD-endopeptidase MepM/ murein hydrolase activator NlpD
MRRAAAAFAVLTGLVAGVLFAALPAVADVTAQDVEEARAELRAVNERLADQVARYEAAVVEEIDLQSRLEQVSADTGELERQLVLARRLARDRVADIYMSAGISRVGGIFGVNEFGDVPTRIAYLDTVAESDREIVVQLDGARAGLERQQALLADLVSQQTALRLEMETLLGGIYDELEAANAEYQAVKTQWDEQEAERRYLEWLATSTTTTQPPTTTTSPPDDGAAAAATTPSDGTGTTTPSDGTGTTTPSDGTGTTGAPAPTTTTQPPPPPPPPQPGVRVCPVDGAVTFRDSWGEPRPGGRTHTGTDMMAATGTPLVAIEDGYIWYMSWHYAGGNGLYIQGDSGDRWYYAHLDGYAGGIETGVQVSAGQVVGYVGSTGNASVPHLHIAHIVGGETYINPYPVLAQIC